MATPYGTLYVKAGISKTDSADELTLFFQLLANQLSQSTEEIIKRMKEDDITVEDLAHMNKNDLYGFGVETFSDAKLILQHARSHRQLVRERSGSQGNRGTEGQLAQQHCESKGNSDTEVILKRKLIDVPPSVRDVFTANLDPDLEGVPSWEQFGEKLLNMDATDLRQFRACDSPTKAILNKMVATAPSATLEDAFRALEAIGRKDVTELVLQKLESLGSMSKQQSLDRPQSSLQFDQRPPLVHQGSSTSSEAPVTHNKPSTLAYSEYPSAQHIPHIAISVGSNPILTHSNTVNEYQKSNLLPKQPSVEQPNLTTTATLSAQTPDQQSTTEELCSLLKAMTTNDSQQEIHITCKVYNAATNQLIKGEFPLLRDITITPRIHSTSVSIGTKLRLEVTVDSSSYLYVLNIGTSGSTTMLLPNKYETDNFFHANQTYHFPGRNYGFGIQGPTGKEVIQVMAFSNQQDILTLHSSSAIQKELLLRDIHVLQNTPQMEKRGFAQVEFTVT